MVAAVSDCLGTAIAKDMDEDEVADVLYEPCTATPFGSMSKDTVLAKVVKSQVWMPLGALDMAFRCLLRPRKETMTLPHEFIIFCWVPPVGAYKCLQDPEAMLWTVASERRFLYEGFSSFCVLVRDREV